MEQLLLKCHCLKSEAAREGKICLCSLLCRAFERQLVAGDLPKQKLRIWPKTFVICCIGFHRPSSCHGQVFVVRAIQATMTSLRELDVGKAANLLTWTLKVESPRVTNVKYLYQGNTVSYQKFECLLVAEDNSYCAAELKSTKKNAKLAAEAFEQFVDQSTWQMKLPSFVESKLQCISSMVKKVINLGATKMQKNRCGRTMVCAASNYFSRVCRLAGEPNVRLHGLLGKYVLIIFWM